MQVQKLITFSQVPVSGYPLQLRIKMGFDFGKSAHSAVPVRTDLQHIFLRYAGCAVGPPAFRRNPSRCISSPRKRCQFGQVLADSDGFEFHAHPSSSAVRLFWGVCCCMADVPLFPEPAGRENRAHRQSCRSSSTENVRRCPIGLCRRRA